MKGGFNKLIAVASGKGGVGKSTISGRKEDALKTELFIHLFI